MTRIYFAGPPPFAGKHYVELMKGRNILVSFGEHRRAIYSDLGIFGRVILDSGAFSAYTGGKKVEINDFISYLQKNSHHFEWYASLDVIGDWKKSFHNYLEMREQGLYPVPVFHGDEPYEILEYYRRQSALVALGSTPGWSKETRTQWLRRVVEDYPHKYHLFRGTDTVTLEQFSFESTDSSTWARAASYGMIPLPPGGRTRISELSCLDRARAWVRYFELLEERKLNGKQCGSPSCSGAGKAQQTG